MSNLTSSDPEELARINGATLLTVFQTGKEVIVPVNCSCLTRGYYQAETKYVLSALPTTYFKVANDTFQGLSTCDSLKRANPYGELDLHAGMELHVPLRCACPTWHQAKNGTKYLLTYSVNWGDSISSIATRFNTTTGNLLDANGFPTQTPTLFPFTTVLIPLPSEPVISTIIVSNDPPNYTSPHPASTSKGIKSKSIFHIAVATAGVSILILRVILSLVFLFRKRSERFFKGGRRCKRKRVTSEDIRVEIASIEHLSKVYRFEEIKEATENFSPKNRIKGCVFRGVFGNGKDIFAVKRVRRDASMEVNLLKRVNHFNLIKPQGYCENEGCFYLVFEFMESGSLREWLSKDKSMKHHSLAKRIQIALDIANGLRYLHNFIEPCYMQKDINSGNILLNKDLRAKIANFALAEESERRITSCSSTCCRIERLYGPRVSRGRNSEYQNGCLCLWSGAIGIDHWERFYYPTWWKRS